ncbi:hypothetical protein OG871_06370 [Kitasatospora sp. NBC_00374]|uniref:hypothetical protein n=1 Tax=Kitasatospora sp. NBC_00374 TaxID=2975964 RepID=UPI0030DE5204
MAEQPHVHMSPEDLRGALAEVQAAYDRLMAAEHPDPEQLADLRRRSRELHAEAEEEQLDEPHGRAERIHCRCSGATHGAEWIIQHAR